jgi:cell division protein FtsB
MSKRNHTNNVTLIMFRSPSPIDADTIKRVIPCKAIFSRPSDSAVLYAVRLLHAVRHSEFQRGCGAELSAAHGDLVRFGGFGAGVFKTFGSKDDGCWFDAHFTAMFSGANDAVRDGVTVVWSVNEDLPEKKKRRAKPPTADSEDKRIISGLKSEVARLKGQVTESEREIRRLNSGGDTFRLKQELLAAKALGGGNMAWFDAHQDVHYCQLNRIHERHAAVVEELNFSAKEKDMQIAALREQNAFLKARFFS